jgi:hypothetical protein
LIIFGSLVSSDLGSQYIIPLVLLLCQSQSHFVTDGQSVSLGTELSGNHDQILAVVKTSVVLSWDVHPDRRTGLPCNRSQFLSVLEVYTYMRFSYSTSYSWGCSPDFVQQIMLIAHILPKGITEV